MCWHSWFNYSSTHHDVVALHLGLLACELLTLHLQPETSDQVMNPASLALRLYLYLQHTIAWPQLLALLRATGKGATRCSNFRTLRMYEVPRQANNNRNVGEWRRLHNKELYAHHSGDKAERTEMGSICSTHVGEERCIKGFDGKTWGKKTIWKTHA